MEGKDERTESQISRPDGTPMGSQHDSPAHIQIMEFLQELNESTPFRKIPNPLIKTASDSEFTAPLVSHSRTELAARKLSYIKAEFT